MALNCPKVPWISGLIKVTIFCNKLWSSSTALLQWSKNEIWLDSTKKMGHNFQFLASKLHIEEFWKASRESYLLIVHPDSLFDKVQLLLGLLVPLLVFPSTYDVAFFRGIKYELEKPKTVISEMKWHAKIRIWWIPCKETTLSSLQKPPVPSFQTGTWPPQIGRSQSWNIEEKLFNPIHKSFIF